MRTGSRRVAPGLVVWLVGLVLGSLAPRTPPQPPTDVIAAADATGAGGRLSMLAVDLHVHAFPGDGTLWPWDLAREARRRGLHAVAITNHNQMLAPAVARLARSWMPDSVLILPGQEVTAPLFHMSAVGIRSSVAWNQAASEVIDEIHAQGGVAIAAHPARRYAAAYGVDALAALDAAEAAHPMAGTSARHRLDFGRFYARATGVHPGIAAVGSSDFHREAPVGLCRTYVFVGSASEAGVIEAVRQGRTAACDPRGVTTGAEPWRSLARDECRRAARSLAQSPARAAGWLDRLAVACALVGLLAWVTAFRRAPAPAARGPAAS